uniref:Uncharacterized protein n=1 Tax=Mesocestoides corti TaxID=53468 RepID=A0A5K3FFG8_MESCO
MACAVCRRNRRDHGGSAIAVSDVHGARSSFNRITRTWLGLHHVPDFSLHPPLPVSPLSKVFQETSLLALLPTRSVPGEVSVETTELSLSYLWKVGTAAAKDDAVYRRVSRGRALARTHIHGLGNESFTREQRKPMTHHPVPLCRVHREEEAPATRSAWWNASTTLKPEVVVVVAVVVSHPMHLRPRLLQPSSFKHVAVFIP